MPQRVYSQFCIETIHGRLKWSLQSVLLIRIGKQNVEIKYK